MTNRNNGRINISPFEQNPKIKNELAGNMMIEAGSFQQTVYD